jgi:UDP-3-O-[3-hydroxymyristoyl] glucosamine N-acyltransferase
VEKHKNGKIIMVKKKIDLTEFYHLLCESPQILGEADTYDLVPSFINDASQDSITFCSKTDRGGLKMIRDSKAKVIICSNQLRFSKDDYKNKILILVSNPKLVFVRVLQEYFGEKFQFGISPMAVIDKDASINSDVYIGPYCYIGRCHIGAGTIIYGNVHIYSDVKIGREVIIEAGTVIGANGMEYVKNENGEFERMPHLSGVIIEDNVDIGANVSIMRGVLRNTIIGQGTKVGPFCSIGHQAVIGKHCLIITRSLIGGSTHIGNHSRISMGAIIRDGIDIGENVTIGMGSVVTKNIDDGWVVFGVPAKKVRRDK